MRPARAAGRLLAVRVSPGAARTEVVGWQGGALRVRVTAPPESGRANQAVATLLAGALDVPRSAVTLVRGVAARDKLFQVGSLTAEQVRDRLAALPGR